MTEKQLEMLSGDALPDFRTWWFVKERQMRRRQVSLYLLVAVLFVAAWQIGAWLLGVCCTGGGPCDFAIWLARKVPFLAFLAGAVVCRLAEELIWPADAASEHWPYLLIVVAVAGACGHALWPH